MNLSDVAIVTSDNPRTEDPKKIGYVPEIKLIEDGEEVYCKRCYDIMHHNARYDYSTSTENYYKKISSIKNTNSLIILIVDVLNLNSSFIPNLKDYIGNNKVLILINKTDILPNTIKLNHLEMHVKKLALDASLNVASVMLISASKKQNVDKVLDTEFEETYQIYQELLYALQNKDFKTFASIYNGPGQVDYYGNKLEQAYNQYK